MTLQIADDLREFLAGGSQPPAEAARELIVLELYREHRISRGKAAELVSESLEDFLTRAGKLGIPYSEMSDDQVADEFEAVKKLSRADHL